jgi:hypothetical protein
MKTEHQKIHDRQIKQKEQFIELFKKTPIVQIVCERVGISRATYYRWQKEDSSFYTEIVKSEQEGRSFLNDAMESILIQKAKDGDTTALIFYLKNNHPRYSESWSSIQPTDIASIADYLKNYSDDPSGDKTFIASLFEKRIPYRVARQILRSMRFLALKEEKQSEIKKVDLLTRLADVKNS